MSLLWLWVTASPGCDFVYINLHVETGKLQEASSPVQLRLDCSQFLLPKHIMGPQIIGLGPEFAPNLTMSLSPLFFRDTLLSWAQKDL